MIMIEQSNLNDLAQFLKLNRFRQFSSTKDNTIYNQMHIQKLYNSSTQKDPHIYTSHNYGIQGQFKNQTIYNYPSFKTLTTQFHHNHASLIQQKEPTNIKNSYNEILRFPQNQFGFRNNNAQVQIKYPLVYYKNYQNHFALVNPSGYNYQHKASPNLNNRVPLIQNNRLFNQKRVRSDHIDHGVKQVQNWSYKFKPLKRTDQAQFIKRSIKLAHQKANLIQNIIQTQDDLKIKCKCKNAIDYSIIEEDDKTDAPYCQQWC